MSEKRISIFPPLETELEPMKSTGRDGNVFETFLEHKTQKITLGNYSYYVFVGSTAGRKGLPNQDFAGVASRKINIEDMDYDCLLLLVADGVSSRELSEETSKSVVENVVANFANNNNSYSSFKSLSTELWDWAAEGAQKAPAPRGVSTVSLFLIAASGEETKGVAINCGDSRIYWATSKYVESAKVHTEVLNPRNAISYALGADRINNKIHHDAYFIDNPVEILLCTDTFAYTFDGVHMPEEMIPTFGAAISSLKDHLTAISVKRI